MPDPAPHYERVILKISGESFAGADGQGIDASELALVASEIVDAADTGTKVAVVVGGGNLVRGASLAETLGMDQSVTDYMGMLATVMNGMALKEAIEAAGREARLMSALQIPSVAEPFIRARALRHFAKGRVLILVAGTGNPFVTTDTCAALRGIELSADILLKATKVDGVYSADPHEHPDAVRYDVLSFAEAIERQLGIMDLTAMSMCLDHDLPVRVFDFRTSGNIRRVVKGEPLGTMITKLGGAPISASAPRHA